jgi:hypothetical protein
LLTRNGEKKKINFLHGDDDDNDDNDDDDDDDMLGVGDANDDDDDDDSIEDGVRGRSGTSDSPPPPPPPPPPLSDPLGRCRSMARRIPPAHTGTNSFAIPFPPPLSSRFVVVIVPVAGRRTVRALLLPLLL